MSKQKKIETLAAHDPSESLINACLANDRKAQVNLYKRYAKSMFNVSFRMVKDQMLAEDIMQEAFISAFRALKNFKREVPFYSWLRKIVINKSLDEIRRRKVKFTELFEDTAATEFSDDVNEEDAGKEEMLKQLKKELYNLPDGYRIILSLFYLEGYDHEEIGQILNISSSTSRSQITRARRALAKRLKTE